MAHYTYLCEYTTREMQQRGIMAEHCTTAVITFSMEHVLENKIVKNIHRERLKVMGICYNHHRVV